MEEPRQVRVSREEEAGKVEEVSIELTALSTLGNSDVYPRGSMTRNSARMPCDAGCEGDHEDP